MSQGERDVAAMLHVVKEGTPWYQVNDLAKRVWGWDEERIQAAHTRLGQHVRMSGQLKSSGQDLIERYPLEAFADLREAEVEAAQEHVESLAAELASLAHRRRILREAVANRSSETVDMREASAEWEGS